MPEVKSLTINPSFRFSALDESGEPWDIIIASGIVRAENVILINSHASGGAQFFAMPSCIDGGGNTGWIFLESPDLETHAATLVTTNSALANAEIINTAGVNATRRGFCFVEGAGAPTIADNTTYEDGSFAAGEYSLPLALSQSKTYTVRAYFVGGDGIVTYGNSVTVITYPEAPTGVLATPTDENSIELSWDYVANVDYYRIYFSNTPGITKENSFVESFYSPYVHAELIPGLRYYYRISSIFGNTESELSLEFSAESANTYPTFYPHNWEETAYYVGLLTSQYQFASKFKAWLQYNIEILRDGMESVNDINNVFDIDFAVGNQLDIIGEIVGQKRVLPFQPSDGSEPNLDDETYRTLLRAKVALNQWDGQLHTIEEKWASIFPGTKIIIVDNQDMSISVDVVGEMSSLIKEMIENGMIMPHPQAVQINYNWSIGIQKEFAWDYDEFNNQYGGWDIGHWKTE